MTKGKRYCIKEGQRKNISHGKTKSMKEILVNS